MDYKSMSLTEITKLPGVSDIEPLMARAKFAQALRAESEGDREKAGLFLKEAISKEG